MTLSKWIFPLSLVFTLLIGSDLYGQPGTSGPIQVQTIDFRGQRPQKAVVAASAASEKKVIVVLLQCHNQALIDATEGTLKGLIRDGYTRIGFILADTFSDENTPTISIFMDGLAYAVVKNAEPTAKIRSDVYKLIRDAYHEDISPIKK